jgi:hypothetical protein
MNRVTNSAGAAVADSLLKSVDNAQTVVKAATDLVQRVTAAKALRAKKAADARAAAKAASDSAASAMDAYLAGK